MHGGKPSGEHSDHKARSFERQKSFTVVFWAPRVDYAVEKLQRTYL